MNDDLRKELRQQLSQLSITYKLSVEQLVELFQLVSSDWKKVENCPNYEIHSVTNVIRNRKTHRILKPNNCGHVRLKTKDGNDYFKKQNLNYLHVSY
ncbi:hypothetical protein GNP79_13880 [Aliivibrio fischeri]|uniref:Uncharacterized protein n=1 Tax=Aliivibrio fischeri TaxID=668 RepID=A0A6N3Z383_ALIFS|nr:hypothetical protein [Aliivibrio fischeri]MUK46401.1 hypothetical protein [Aliivibrio fischeri]MUK81886.1 hypothetical protein [Aliivibrio fischeri]MUK85060.1 hypothetical protein [Aliivibrio fischeri]